MEFRSGSTMAAPATRRREAAGAAGRLGTSCRRRCWSSLRRPAPGVWGQAAGETESCRSCRRDGRLWSLQGRAPRGVRCGGGDNGGRVQALVPNLAGAFQTERSKPGVAWRIDRSGKLVQGGSICQAGSTGQLPLIDRQAGTGRIDPPSWDYTAAPPLIDPEVGD